MKFKRVLRSWMELNGRRLDCGPYMSGAIEARAAIEKLSLKKQPRLWEVTKGGMNGIYHAGREGRIYVNDPRYGVPFLRSTSVLAADLSFLPLLSKKQVTANPLFIIQEGGTLITRSGTIGRMAYSRVDMAGMACSEDVLRVIPDTEKVLSGYLYAYLHSRFGVPLVISGTYGAIIQHIEPDHIADLPVPRLGNVEEECHALVQQSAELLERYQAGVKRATEVFFTSVGLRDITAAEWHSKGPDLGFSQAFPRHDSFRGMNFNPRFMRLSEQMKMREWKTLGEICIPNTLKCGERFIRIDADPEHSYQLIGQKQLFWLKPEGRWVAKSKCESGVLVKPGTILIPARGTLGESELFCRAEFIWGASSELAYSENSLRVVSDQAIMPRGCLFAFLRSETSFRMLRSISMGTKLQDHHPSMLRELPVPYPPREIRDKIHSMIVEAYEARHTAVSLEREAIQLVENAIMGET